MGDTFWINLRYALIAAGTGLIINYTKGMFTAEQATVIAQPLVDLIIGILLAGGAWAWGNYVRWGTKAVPVETAKRDDVPTVSSVTGQVQ